MDTSKEDTTNNKSNDNEVDSIPDCNRSDSGDEAWMLIEVEKFQDALDESFLNSTVTQKSDTATTSHLETVVDEPDVDIISQGSVVKGDFGSLVISEHSNPNLFNSNNSHSSVESAHSHTQTTPSDVDPDTCPIVKQTLGGVQQDSSGGCSTSINASEMLRDYFNEHSGNTPAVTSIPDVSESEDDDDDDSDMMGVEALRQALQKAEEEAHVLREKVHSLLVENLNKDMELQELRRDQEEKQRREDLEREQREQMKLLEKSTSTITHTAPGPTADMVVSLRALTQRVRNLERETRQTRLLDEQRQGECVSSAHGGAGSGAIAGQDMRLLEEEEEKGEDVLSGLIARLGEQLSGLENELIPLVSRLQASLSPSEQTPFHSSTPQETSLDDLKISLRNFAANDIALFFPTPKGEYLAFNIGAPHHFLSAESKALIGQDQHFKKLYVLGRIVMVETQRVEGATTPAGDAHPKGLAKGMQYHALSVASVADQLK